MAFLLRLQASDIFRLNDAAFCVDPPSDELLVKRNVDEGVYPIAVGLIIIRC